MGGLADLFWLIDALGLHVQLAGGFTLVLFDGQRMLGWEFA